jgi:nucleoside-diphosphate-sugar epimerase
MPGMAERTLLVGPGWLGGPTAERLAAAGHRVWTLHRSGGTAPRGCVAVTGDVTTAATAPVTLTALPPAVEHLVVCVAPSSARGDSYAIYPAAARGAQALAAALGVRHVVYVSSTGIYDRHDGSEVSESVPIAPTNPRVQALLDAEQAIASAASDRVRVDIVRAAGLYGPGRDPADRFARGAVPPDTWCNFSWRDDVAEAIRHLLTQPAASSVHVFNCTDGHPVQAAAIRQALTGSARSRHEVAGADGPGTAGRSSQRIRTDALQATGWQPSVPTVFDGLRRLGHTLPGLAATVS